MGVVVEAGEETMMGELGLNRPELLRLVILATVVGYVALRKGKGR